MPYYTRPKYRRNKLGPITISWQSWFHDVRISINGIRKRHVWGPFLKWMI